VAEGNREFKQEDQGKIEALKEQLNTGKTQKEIFSQGLGRLQKQSRQQSGNPISGLYFQGIGSNSRTRFSHNLYSK
jgi:hypothetical protein